MMMNNRKNVDQNDEDQNENGTNLELDYLSEESITKTVVENYKKTGKKKLKKSMILRS